MAAFNSLGHIALKVQDLEASIGFYEKLGFPEFLRLTEEDGAAWIAYLRFDDNLYLELFPGGTSRVAGPEATGTNHLCLTVDDIEVAERHLAQVGIGLMHPRTDQRGLDRNRGMWIEDPDGNRIEIMEMARDCIQFQAIAKLKAGGGRTSVVAPTKPKKVA